MKDVLSDLDSNNLCKCKEKKEWAKPEVTIINSKQILAGTVPGTYEHHKTYSVIYYYVS